MYYFTLLADDFIEAMFVAKIDPIDAEKCLRILGDNDISMRLFEIWNEKVLGTLLSTERVTDKTKFYEGEISELIQGMHLAKIDQTKITNVFNVLYHGNGLNINDLVNNSIDNIKEIA